MTTKDEMLYDRLEKLEERQEKLEERLAAYDILAAKWGGMCMIAVALGGTIFTYSDKFIAFLSYITSLGKKS